MLWWQNAARPLVSGFLSYRIVRTAATTRLLCLGVALAACDSAPSDQAADVRPVVADGEQVRVALGPQSPPAPPRKVSAVDSANQEAARYISYPAMVALQPTLGTPGAAAVVLRRANLDPHDVILLGETDAGPATLGSAVTALVKARRRGGDVPTQDERLVILDRGAPASWAREGLDADARALIAQARATAPVSIAGVGVLRAFEIQVGRQKRKSN